MYGVEAKIRLKIVFPVTDGPTNSTPSGSGSLMLRLQPPLAPRLSLMEITSPVEKPSIATLVSAQSFRKMEIPDSRSVMKRFPIVPSQKLIVNCPGGATGAPAMRVLVTVRPPRSKSTLMSS